MKFFFQIAVAAAVILCISSCDKEEEDLFDIYVAPVQLSNNHTYKISWKAKELIPDFNPYMVDISILYAGAEKTKNFHDIPYENFFIEVSLDDPNIQKGDIVCLVHIYDWGFKNVLHSSKAIKPQKIYPNDWQADWISYNTDLVTNLPVFKKSFNIEKPEDIIEAGVDICAPGFYDLYLNNQRIGDDYLSPAQTNFDDYAFYNSYSIPNELLQKENEFKVYLGSGWYAQDSVWSKRMKYGTPLFILEAEFSGDKEIVNIISDKTWEYTKGPYVNSNIYAGDYYDARIEAALENQTWQMALIDTNPPKQLYPHVLEPIKQINEIQAESITNLGDSAYIVDFGKNITGWVKCKIDEAEGVIIQFKTAEEIDSLGRLDTESTGVFATKVEQIDTYISNGKKVTWQPRFTYHGFRYAEIKGLNKTPQPEDLHAVVLMTDMTKVGHFECSDEQINKIHELNIRTIEGNMLGVPVDCPHREKNGWTGDAHIITPSLMYNFNAETFLDKFLLDVQSSAKISKKEIHFRYHFKDRYIAHKPAGVPFMTAPGKRRNGVASPEWGAAIVQIPWYLFKYTGDTGYLRKYHNSMQIWVEHVSSLINENLIEYGLGDWCPPGGNAARQCPIPISSSAYFYNDLNTLMEVNKILGKDSLSHGYKGLGDRAADLKKYFHQYYYKNDSIAFGSQTANILALKYDLAYINKREAVAKALVNNLKTEGFITTGIFGLKNIFQVLCENGYSDVAYEVLTKTGYNSFEYMWEHYDATTMWEVLPVDDYYENEEKNDHKRSHNHPMNASTDAFFYSHILGINVDFTNDYPITLKPYFLTELDNAKGEYNSTLGVIKSEWTNDELQLEWHVTIPNGTKAGIYIPKMKKRSEVWVNNNKEYTVEHADSSMVWLKFNLNDGMYKIIYK